MVRVSSTIPTEIDKQYHIKEIIHREATNFIDAGWKPNMANNKYLRDALAKEYARRLRLEIHSYPRNRWKKVVGHKNILDLSWRQLEKIVEKLKRKRIIHKSRKRRKRRKRKTRRR